MSKISKDINLVKNVLFAEYKIDPNKAYTDNALRYTVWGSSPRNLLQKVEHELHRIVDGELVDIYYNEGLKTGYGEVVWYDPDDDRMISKSALYKFTVDDNNAVHVSSKAASTSGERSNAGRIPARFLVTESSIRYKDEI